MEKLQDLSQSELQELLDNAERVESMALESDEIQNIQLEREMALASNRSLAEQNLDMKPQLETQKETLVERYSQLESVRDTYRQHCALRDGMAGQVSPEALFTRLQTEGAKTEVESEALADEFLEGSLPLDSFLEQFLSLRSLAHKRRVRIEKLQEIVRQRSESADSSGMTSSACAGQDPLAPTSPWNPQTTTTNHQAQQPSSKPSAQPAFPNASQASSSAPGGTSGLPYTPYPVSPPNPPPAVAAASGPPYPSPSFAGSRPGFGPLAASACPYPISVSLSPHPGSAFGQYIPSQPQSGLAPYPASYSYGGYSYPTGPNYSSSQSPTGRPIYRPGYGVPQPHS